MTTLHLADLAGGLVAARAAVAADIRTYHVDFADCVYGDTRATAGVADALGLLVRSTKEFIVVVYATDILTVLDEHSFDDRIRSYSVEVCILQKYVDGASEDTFLERVELIENGLAGRSRWELDINGLTVHFLPTSFDRVVPISVTRNPDGYEAIAHSTVRQITMEVTACG